MTSPPPTASRTGCCLLDGFDIRPSLTRNACVFSGEVDRLRVGESLTSAIQSSSPDWEPLSPAQKAG